MRQAAANGWTAEKQAIWLAELLCQIDLVKVVVNHGLIAIWFRHVHRPEPRKQSKQTAVQGLGLCLQGSPVFSDLPCNLNA